VHVLEERSVLNDLVTRSLVTSSMGGVQVLIGGEGTGASLRPFSVVLARYGTPGPDYRNPGCAGPHAHVLRAHHFNVRFLAGLLSDLVSDTLSE